MVRSGASRVLALLVMAAVLGGPALAQDAPAEAEEEYAWPPEIPGLVWTPGPATARLGTWSELKLPAGWSFTDTKGAAIWAEATRNPPSPSELGVVLPPKGGGTWYAYFEFDESGYVKDDDKSSLDADDLLDALKAGNERGNEERVRRGWPRLELVGWAEAPHYDDDLKVLVWATKVRSEGGESINYDARLLGRRGVMKAGLVCGVEDFSAVLPQFKSLCRGHEFVSGQRYAEFRSGDRVAEYGLAALVTGGALAVAAKTGLLQKFWKVIVVAIAGLVAGAKKLFGGGAGKERRSRSRVPRGDAST